MSGDREETAVELVPQSAIESMERAQIDVQIATAKRWPRDIAKVKRDIETFATLDRETAEACFYSLPRGGKSIQGPSVRMAEIAVHSFGNIRVQTRVMETVTSGGAPHVTIQSVCADLEKNVAVSIEKRRRIVGKKSHGGKIDEDDINLAANAGAAIAFRDAAFKVIPMALIKPAFLAAKNVAIGDAKTLSQRRSDAISRFAKMGVDQNRVLAMLGKTHVDSVDLADLETLFGVFTAIREKETTIEEQFPIEVITPKTEVKTGTQAQGKKLPNVSQGKPVERASSTQAAPPEAKPEEPPEEPGDDTPPKGDLPYDDPEPEREPGADESEDDPPPEEEPKPAVRGGVTGATEPLGARKKNRTLANPNG